MLFLAKRLTNQLLLNSNKISHSCFSTSKPPNDSEKLNEQKPSARQTMRSQYWKVWNICKPQLPKYLFNGVLTLIHAGLFMYIPYIYGDLTHLMSLKVSTTPAMEIYSQYLLMTGKWALVFGFLGAITYRRRFEFIDISNRISSRLRNVLYKQILQQDFYKKNSTVLPQTFVHHLITDVKTVSEFTGEAIFMGLRGMCFLLGGAGMLVYTSPYICMIALGIMTAFNLTFRSRNQTLKKLKQQENSILVNLSEFSSERFHNMKLIKISNTELFEQLRFMKELKRFYDYSIKVSEANGINYGSLECFGLFSLFCVAAAGSFLISMEVTEFSLIASSTYALYVAMGFRSLMFFNTELMKILGVYANIEGKLGDLALHPQYHEPFFPDHLQLQEQKLQKLFQQHYSHLNKGLSIKITNLNFTYIYEDENHIYKSQLYKDFNLQINPGEIVSVVGDSGSGKSTLFNLITGLSQPSSGRIEIDGVSNVQLNFEMMQKMISYVTQESYLFAGSFMDNLRYGNHGFDLSVENIEKCCRMVNAWQLIQQKGGLQIGRVEEKGNNLSGGEKQRIILARALIKHPRLLLLDEATSGIDSESEKMIIEGLKHYNDSGKRMTVLLISHKLEAFREIVTKAVYVKPQKAQEESQQKD